MAACKCKRAEFERIQSEESSSPHADAAMDVIPAGPVPPPAPLPEPVAAPAEIRAADLRGRKRESEQTEDLEAEIHEGMILWNWNLRRLICVGLTMVIT